jgi:hypothetical protein
MAEKSGNGSKSKKTLIFKASERAVPNLKDAWIV